MKKTIVIVMALVMAIWVAGCGSETTVTTAEEKTVAVSSYEEMEILIEEDVAATTAGLAAEYEELVAEVDDFQAYHENMAAVQAFYDRIYEVNKDACIRVCEYSAAYAELILASGGTNDEKEDAIDDMYDCLYDDARDDLYDAIYDNLMDDMYDAFYDGVVSDGYDYIAYEKWYDMSSEAYDMWSDCSSDVYDVWSDSGSDVYDFWSDVYGALWDGDDEELKETIADFKAEIEAMKAEEE